MPGRIRSPAPATFPPDAAPDSDALSLTTVRHELDALEPLIISCSRSGSERSRPAGGARLSSAVGAVSRRSGSKYATPPAAGRKGHNELPSSASGSPPRGSRARLSSSLHRRFFCPTGAHLTSGKSRFRNVTRYFGTPGFRRVPRRGPSVRLVAAGLGERRCGVTAECRRRLLEIRVHFDRGCSRRPRLAPLPRVVGAARLSCAPTERAYTPPPEYVAGLVDLDDWGRDVVHEVGRAALSSPRTPATWLSVGNPSTAYREHHPVRGVYAYSSLIVRSREERALSPDQMLMAIALRRGPRDEGEVA